MVSVNVSLTRYCRTKPNADKGEGEFDGMKSPHLVHLFHRQNEATPHPTGVSLTTVVQHYTVWRNE